MENVEEIEQIIKLIQSLYSNETLPIYQTLAQKKLQEVQSSDLAWSIIPTLLNHSDSTVRFFAASTLQIKISISWSTLPPSSYEVLKQSLLTWLATSASQSYPNNVSIESRMGEKLVLRKLASAITSLSLRLEDWNEWLLEVIMRVNAGYNGISTTREGVLEVLAVVIEQVARASLVGQKRIAYMSNLSSSIPHIVTTLASSLPSLNTSFTEINSALTCFNSFLLSNQIPTTDLTTLYPLILPHLNNSHTSINACSAIEEIIERSSGISSLGDTQRFLTRKKVEELVSGWANSIWVHEIVNNAIREEEADEEAMGVMRLLCVLGEYFIGFLFDSPSSSQIHTSLKINSIETIQFLQTLLSITLFPGYSLESFTINELGIGIWMTLQEESSDIGLISGPGEGREGRIGREEEWIVIRDVFTALANGLRERCQRPNLSITKDWTKDLDYSFKSTRNTTYTDMLLYCYYTLREAMLSGLVTLAAQQVARPPNSSEDAYEDLEATLFCLLTIQEALNPTTSTPFLNHLFSTSILGSLPNIPSIQSTTLRLIGNYSNWFATESESQSEEGNGGKSTNLILVLNFVINALSKSDNNTINKGLRGDAAVALRLLCESGRKNLVGHVGGFVEVLGGLEGNIEDTELIKVLESVSSVVQALSMEEIIEPLLSLANPIITKLQSSVDGYASLPIEARELCLQQLSYLTACAKGLSDPEGDLIDLDNSFDLTQFQSLTEINDKLLNDNRILDMRFKLGKAIEGITGIWSRDVEVVQALSDYIKYSTSDATPSPIALHTFSLFSLATSAIQNSLSSVWLSIATSLIIRLARDQNDTTLEESDIINTGEPTERALTAVLSAFSNLGLMDENPDVVNAFLSFCISIIQHYPRIFTVLPNHLDAVITFAERGLGMQERFSLKATIDLLLASVQQTRMASTSSTIFKQTILPHTLSILQSLLLSIAGSVPRTHLTELSELLHAFILRLPNETRMGLKQLLSIQNWPNEKATTESKLKFEKIVTSARTGKQVREAVSDFALVCRGLDGSAYGIASSSAFR